MPKQKKLLTKQLNDLFGAEDVSAEQVREIIRGANPIDIAEILGNFDSEEKLRIFNALEEDARALVIDETDESSREELIECSNLNQISELINSMPPDEATDLLESVPEDQRAEVLENVNHEKAKDVIELDRYAPETAGGIMTTLFHSSSMEEKVGDVLVTVRQETEMEAPNFVFVVDSKDRLVRVVCVSELLTENETAPIISVSNDEPITANVDDDQEAVSNLAVKYNLQVVPIVDDYGRMLGIVTHDDVVDVMEQEAVEDLYKFAGENYHPLSEPVINRVMKRFPWLAITLGGGMLLSFILKQMKQEGPLVFLPVIAGMAGNVGIQSSAQMVRGLATGEVAELSRMRLLVREFLVGLSIGIVCGFLTGLVAHALQGGAYPGIGLATGIGMSTGITLAAVLGTVVPMLCNTISVDPAIAAGPFITTMNDVVCSVLYVKIASVLIQLGHKGG